MSTLAELEAQQAALDLAKDTYSRPFIDSAHAALSSEAAHGLVVDLRAAFDGLPGGEVKTQIGNLLSVFAYVPVRVAAEAERLSQILDAPSEP
ncbi:hypothetical protein [Caulobacter endophyticus]|uniref:Uncharacterized protein n=1 Tax=Caulobacter endophyticus TaxID=2172652 RepID=A0A2T9K3U4_9CAUL|nr:hypothetical protein [Caulobacter endophyticus]PVM90655.1 hypothetical protein DDF67_09495 [Caulobacter endophyticus]